MRATIQLIPILMLLHTPLAESVRAEELPAEARSLTGIPLRRPDIPAERRAKLEADLAKARDDYDANPGSEDAAIWYGRRLAYLGRYRDAIDVFSRAIERHPQSYKLLR